MKKCTFALLSVFFVLGLFSFNLNFTSASGCASGDLFNSVTGQACASQQGDSSVLMSKFNSVFNPGFKIGLKSNYVKPLQQFLKDEGYYFGKIDGKYGKITARAVQDFQDDNSTPSVITATLPTIPVNSRPYIVSITGNQSTYLPGSTMTLEIKGVDGVGYNASKPNGYNIQAYIFPVSDTSFTSYISPTPSASYNATYKSSSSSWNIKTNVPSILGSYNMRVVLYCSKIGDDCVNYGDTTYKDSVQIIPFNVVANSQSTSTSSNNSNSSLAITTTSLPDATVGSEYKAYLYASDVSDYYIWSMNSGSLPPGLSFTASKDCGILNSGLTNVANCILIYGTPTTPGSYSLNLKVSANLKNPVVATKQLTLNIVAPSSSYTASLNADATIKANLSNLRAQAELIYDQMYNSYSNVCSNSMSDAIIRAAVSASGSPALCSSNPTAWAVMVPLKTNPSIFWCVDSLGASRQTMQALGVATACPQ